MLLQPIRNYIKSTDAQLGYQQVCIHTLEMLQLAHIKLNQLTGAKTNCQEEEGPRLFRLSSILKENFSPNPSSAANGELVQFVTKM